MTAKDLYTNLLNNLDAYLQLHGRTSDTDLKVMELLAFGKNPIQVSIEVPCAEATVYRSRKRVEVFLRDELPRYVGSKNNTFYIHNAIAQGIQTPVNVHSYKLYYLLIIAHQTFKDHVDGKSVHKHLPRLKSRAQREETLRELNAFSVVPNEEPKHTIKVFEFVRYDGSIYYFKLTKDALPYYDKFYFLLKIMGIENWPE